MPTGDLLLGCGYENSFCGNYAGGLPGALADNATYGAFRMLEQRAAAFEKRLQDWGEETGLEPGMIAAKLMGRWRNGAPLVLAPDTDDLGQPTLARGLNAFDYPPDDTAGARCPIGSHIRRLNPRGSRVMGKPYSRRLVRRSLPYGPERQQDEPDDQNERGLIGYFLCADLEAQWEFIQRVWVHDDIATAGIRGTREPIGGTQHEDDGAFLISTADGGPIQLGGLQTLTYTRGSVYCLLPGIGGLRWIAAQDGEGGGR